MQKIRLIFRNLSIMPVGAKTYRDALRMGAEIYHFLKLYPA